MRHFINSQTNITEAALLTIAHLPTRSLDVIVEPAFWQKLTDENVMHIAFLLAQKGYNEGGCPIGAVIIDNQTRQIVGKGHNTLVQDGDPYNHGETAAMRDAGRIDFSKTTLFTTLSPCDVCATLVYMRQVQRVVVGDVSNAAGNEDMMRQKGVIVDVMESTASINLYKRYKEEKPLLDLEDWKGVAALRD